MKSFLMQPGFEETMKKVGKKDYRDIKDSLSKLNNGLNVKNLLLKDQKTKK